MPTAPRSTPLRPTSSPPARALGRLGSGLAMAILVLAALAIGPSELRAQEADALFRGLVPFGGLEARLAGEAVPNTKIYLAEKAGAYLILSSTLGDPLLVNVRARQIERLEASKVRENEDGTADLMADTSFDTVGPFEVEGSELRFSLEDGRTIRLGPAPDLLGLQPAAALLEHNPAYGFGADRYPPNEDNIAALEALDRDIRVRVFFGSWCATCSRVLPWVLRVERDLEGSKIQFEYFGLPRAMDSPEAVAADIGGVPTAVLYSGEEEIGRATVPELGVPEKVLLELISKAPSP